MFQKVQMYFSVIHQKVANFSGVFVYFWSGVNTAKKLRCSGVKHTPELTPSHPNRHVIL